MSNKILVTYATLSGSTREVAEAVHGGLDTNSAGIDVIHVDDVADPGLYDAVVVGGPMVLGWHRGAIKFLKKHQQALSRKPVAYFFTAMSLTRTRDTHFNNMPIYMDPALAKCPQKADRPSFRERYATVSNYLGPVLKQAPLITPVSTAFFAGSMDYSRLNKLQLLFVKLVIKAPPGDRRNWNAIQEWAAGLHAQFV